MTAANTMSAAITYNAAGRAIGPYAIDERAFPARRVRDRQLAALIAEWERQRDDYQQAVAALDDLEGRRERVEADDIEAAAAAVRAGKPDPGRAGRDALERDLAEARHKAEVHAAAVAAVGRDLDAALDARKAQAVARAEKAAQEARTSYLDALAAVAAAHERLALDTAELRWLEHRGRRPAKPPTNVVFAELLNVNGEPYRVEELLDALGAIGEWRRLPRDARDQRTWDRPDRLASIETGA